MTARSSIPNAGFTPGPWFESAQLEPLGGCLSRLVMATDTGVAEVLFDDEDDPTAEANARLIAAAPELYAALADCVRRLRKCAELTGNAPFAVDALCEQFEAPLAKARGEQA